LSSKRGDGAFRRLFRYVMREKMAFFAAMTLTMVSAALELVSPLVAGRVVDLVVAGNTSDLWLYAGVILALTLAGGAISFGMEYLGELNAQRVVYRLRMDVYRHLQDLSYSFYDRVDAGQIITRVTSDTDNIGRMLGFALPNFVRGISMLVAVGTVLVFTNWNLALVAFSITPFIAVISLTFNRYVRPLFEKIWVEVSRLNATVQEFVAGFRVVKALDVGDEMFRRFEERNRSIYEMGIRTTKLAALTWPTIGLIFGVGTAAIYWYGGLQIVSGQLSMGGLVSFTMYLGMLIWPIMTMGFMLSNYQQAMVSGRKVFEILDAEPEVKERPGAIDVGRVNGEVRFEDVTFGYDKEKPILRGLSFKVSPGERVAIVGATGSGKSTIVKLIPRFYDPQEGRILIDGFDIRDMSISSLRRNIGIVHQDVFLFPTSIRENISYGKPNATQEEIERVARAARIHDFIASLPEGYNTPVGERGVTLSGGQRQRVAIARALLIDPSILILDDSTSSVDAETEREIYEALKELVRNRTVFIITQRLSTLRLADRIIVVEDGKVVEDGTHEELVRRGGIYARLYLSQYAHQEVRA